MRPGLRRLSSLAALALSLNGCAPGAQRREIRPLRLGMTREEVSASWGFPASKARAASELGTNEQWIYADGRSADFDDGVLKSFQDARTR